MIRAANSLLLSLSLLYLLPVPVQSQVQRIAEIQIAPRNMRMAQDAQAQLVATAYDSLGIPVNVRFRWSSSNIHVAAVGPDGTVRAVAPGTAVITAIVEAEGRRALSRTAVFVMRPARPSTGVGIGVAPGTPAMPPVAATPGVPPVPGGEPRVIRVDSIMRASINCNEPFMNSTNPMSLCWDTRAAMLDTLVVPEWPSRERCGSGVGTITLLLQVNDRGRVDGVLPFASVHCEEFLRQLMEVARRLSFAPAQKDGQPIRAWVRVQIKGP